MIAYVDFMTKTHRVRDASINLVNSVLPDLPDKIQNQFVIFYIDNNKYWKTRIS